MILSSGWLFVIAIGLFIVSGNVIGHSETAKTESRLKAASIYESLWQSGLLAGVAALVAAIVTFFLPSFAEGDASDITLRQLDALIENGNSWLGQSWILISLLAATLLVMALFLGRHVRESTAGRIGTAAKSLGWLKFVFALLAACTFVSGNRSSVQAESGQVLQTARNKLVQAQLLLFDKTQAYLLGMALEEAEVSASASNTSLAAVSTAYGTAGAYFNPPVVPVDAPFDPDPTVDPQPFPEDKDTGPVAGRKEIEPLRDISAVRVEALFGQIEEQASAAKGSTALADQLAKLAVDKSIAGPLKQHLLSFGNPVIDRLVANVTDPLLINPLKKKIGEIAGSWLAGKLDDRAAANAARMAGRENAALSILDLPANVHMAPAGASLGIEEWDRVRLAAAQGVDLGLIGKSQEIQNQARTMETRFLKVRSAMTVLTSSAPNRQVLQEAAFRNYLFLERDYAAFWGYAVIALTPAHLNEDLEKISSYRIAKDRVPDLRVFAQESEENRAKLAERYKIPGDKFLSANDADLAEAVYTSHGAYPIDGMELYFQAVAPDSSAQAVDFYRTEEVSRFVGLFCPAS
jgi:hypothetical protein